MSSTPQNPALLANTPAEAIGPTTAAIINALSSASTAFQPVDASTYVVLPTGYTVKNLTDELEKARPTPDRKRGTAVLHNVASFLSYCEDQATKEEGYIYADVDARTLTAVFDDFKDGAKWRQHRAVFKAEFTPEAMKWFAHDKKVMTQTDFAEFIEDNFADLANEAQVLLDVATTISAKTAIDFSAAKRLDNGQVQLTYNEQIDASAGTNGTLQIPKKFTVGLRLFKGDKAGYAIECRLKYRLNSGRVSFHFEMERPERAIEDAFDGYVEAAGESGYTVLHGKA